MSIILELLRFMLKRKKFWLIPIILICLILGSIVVISEGSVMAPLIYTLF